MKRAYARAAALVILLFAESAFASLYEVDSPEITDRIELKIGAIYREAPMRHLLILPWLELQAPLARNFEIEIDGDYGNETQTEGKRLPMAHATVELKWRLLSGDQHRPSLALVPELTVPLRRSAAAADPSATELELPIVLEKALGSVMLDVRTGYGRELESGGESFIPVGILVRYHPHRSLEIGVEATGQAPCRQMANPSVSVDAGIKWKATGRLELQGLVGKTLRSSEFEEKSMRIKLAVVTAL